MEFWVRARFDEAEETIAKEGELLRSALPNVEEIDMSQPIKAINKRATQMAQSLI
jgi:hypothetical protein